MSIKTLILSLILALVLYAPAAHAASLTPSQISAVISLLQAFGVDKSTVYTVRMALEEEKKEVTIKLEGQPKEIKVKGGSRVEKFLNSRDVPPPSSALTQ